jgi:hypothetical protein
VRFLRSARLTAALAAVTIGLVAGAPCAPATAASALKSCPSGARSEISDAFFTVFSRNDPSATDVDGRAARLAGSNDPGLRAILESWLLDPAGRNATDTVSRIRCTRPDRAVMNVELVLASIPLPEVLPKGTAVRQQGVWKVSKATFCARMILENPTLATRGACAD